MTAHLTFPLRARLALAFAWLLLAGPFLSQTLAQTPALAPAQGTGPKQPLPGVAARPGLISLGEVLSAGFDRKVLAGPRERGALQRTNFLNLVTERKTRLEVALVLDGTNSMGRDLSGAREMLTAFLRRLSEAQPGQREAQPGPGGAGLVPPLPGQEQGPGQETLLSVVVYRDKNAPSGPVVVSFPQFTRSLEEVQKVLDAVQPETGAPYFYELADVGVKQALTELNWSPVATPDVSRWLIVCGDAPPYPADSGLRPVPTRELVQLARAKGIQISAVLCSAGFLDPEGKEAALQKAWQDSLPQTREFFKTLSDETQGGLIDLSNPLVLQALTERVEASREQRQEVVFRPISLAEISTVQQLASKSTSGPPLRVAVLPHVPWDEVLVGTEAPGGLVATELHDRLAHLPRFQLVNSLELTLALHSVRQAKTSAAQFLPQLAKSLAADYVIWGEVTPGPNPEIRSAIYRGAEAHKLVEIRQAAPPGTDDPLLAASSGLASKLVAAVLEPGTGAAADTNLVAALETVREEQWVARGLETPLARDVRARRSLLTGMNILQEALQVAVEGSSSGAKTLSSTEPLAAVQAVLREAGDAQTLLTRARQALETARDFEPDNPFIHLVLANTYFNLARVANAPDFASRARAELEAAHARRGNVLLNPLVRLEIEADHALLVQENDAAAVAKYQEILTSQDVGLGPFALRARWMLAGLYLGDWGLRVRHPELVNPQLAREQIREILAHWELSPEARFYASAREGTAPYFARPGLAQSSRAH